jgi:hypothetical protein
MPAKHIRPTVSAAPPIPPLLIPQPPIAPPVPPAHVVDLMTADGSAMFGARWKANEAKIVECPALTDSMPEFTTTYDIEPHAEITGFDDADWPIIEPAELGAKRGGGMVSFFWFRTALTVPARAAGFDTAGAKAVLTVNIDDYAEIWVNGGCRGRLADPARPQSRASTCRTASCSAIPSHRGTNSRSRSSPSTDRSPPRRPIFFGFVKRRSSSSANWSYPR